MNEMLSEDESEINYANITNQQLIFQDEIQAHEVLNPFIPDAEQYNTKINSTWAYENLPININPNTGITPTTIHLQANDNYDDKTPLESTENLNNNITSSIYLPDEVLLQLNLKPTATEPNTDNIQVLEEHIFNNQKLVASTNVNDQIEIVSAHKCKICGCLFERYDEIIRHLQKCHGSIQQNKQGETKDLYLCGKCEEKSAAYDNMEQLKRHMIVSHNLTKIEDEQSEGNNAINEINHEQLKMLVHNQEIAHKKVKCMIKGCDNSFASKEIMLKHMEYHTEGQKKRFKCKMCDKLFFIWRTCRVHIWKAHKIDIGLYECSMCKSFKSAAPYDLLVHMKIHSNSKTFKPFLCSNCGIQFNRLSDLKNHYNSHLPEKNWNVNCPKCDKTFANSKYLKKHIQSVHDQYKPFICNICGHKCARKSMLDLHLRQHTGEKPYKCELCDFKTGDHNSFRRHILRHSGLSNYMCQHCDYTTIQSSALKLHIKRKHPGKSGFFSCQLCPYNSVNEKLYHNHVENHKIAKSASVLQAEETMDPIVPNVEDEETQIGLYPDHLEDTVDTGGITIPAGIEAN